MSLDHIDATSDITSPTRVRDGESMLSTLIRAASTLLMLIVTVLVLMPAQALASHVRHADISWRLPNPSTAPRTGGTSLISFSW